MDTTEMDKAVTENANMVAFEAAYERWRQQQPWPVPLVEGEREEHYKPLEPYRSPRTRITIEIDLPFHGEPYCKLS